MSALHQEMNDDRAWEWGRATVLVAGIAFVAFAFFALWLTTPIHSKIPTTMLQMHEVDKRIQLYSLKRGVPPQERGLHAVYGDEPVPKDSWGREFVYISPGPRDLEYEIMTYGRDGVPGGRGEDADLYLSEVR